MFQYSNPTADAMRLRTMRYRPRPSPLPCRILRWLDTTLRSKAEKIRSLSMQEHLGNFLVASQRLNPIRVRTCMYVCMKPPCGWREQILPRYYIWYWTLENASKGVEKIQWTLILRHGIAFDSIYSYKHCGRSNIANIYSLTAAVITLSQTQEN